MVYNRLIIHRAHSIPISGIYSMTGEHRNQGRPLRCGNKHVRGGIVGTIWNSELKSGHVSQQS